MDICVCMRERDVIKPWKGRKPVMEGDGDQSMIDNRWIDRYIDDGWMDW
jgi:hypothetical protein